MEPHGVPGGQEMPTLCLPESESNETQPSTPRPNGSRISAKRYPASLSRGNGSNPPVRTPHRRGASRQYETLEDLLTAAGYKETRVITPQRSSALITNSPQPANPIEAITDLGITRRLSNLITSVTTLMPGASVSLGRARGAQLARQEAELQGERMAKRQSFMASAAPSTSSSNSDLTSLSSRQDAIQAPRNKTRTSIPMHLTPPVLPRPLTPSDNRSRATRPPLPQHPSLRHFATSPNLKQPHAHKSRKRAQALKAPEVPLRGRQPIARDENGVRTPRIAKQRGASRTTTRRHPKSGTVTPASTLAPVLKTDAVVCRSTNVSRAPSRVRGSGRTSFGQSEAPPLLSAEVVGESLAAWMDNGYVDRRRVESAYDDADYYDDDEDDDVDPGLLHIVSSRFSPDFSTSSRDSSSATSSSNSYLAVPSRPSLRKEQSIKSLRAHLAPRQASIFGGAKEDTSAPKPFLEGPEWEGATYRAPSRQAPKRGLIPWFGGERNYIQSSNGHRSSMFDDD